MSNITRPFSVVRRRSRLLDLIVPKDPAVQGYRLQAASTFSGVFTTILTADISRGYLDTAVDARKLHSINNRGHVRITFDPQSFNGTSGIADSDQFWLKYQPVDFSGAAGTASDPVLVLPEEKLRGDSIILISGTAPSAVSLAGSLRLFLSGRIQNLSIRNHEAATTMYVGFERGGSEMALAGGGLQTSIAEVADGAEGCILVRGSGATAAFSATFTCYLPL